jgi:AraC-like DNA-binding protein
VPGYLSDMLRSVTGQNAQQLIHQKVIEKAKEILTASDLSVAEIAYHLGLNTLSRSVDCLRPRQNSHRWTSERLLTNQIIIKSLMP